MIWTGELGWASLISGVGLLMTLLVLVKGIGIREADHKYLAARFEKLESKVGELDRRHIQGQELDRDERDRMKDWINKLRDESSSKRDQLTAALSASGEMLRSNVLEFRREIAEKYATKEDIAQLEMRTTRGIERLGDQYEKLDGRLDTIMELLGGRAKI